MKKLIIFSFIILSTLFFCCREPKKNTPISTIENTNESFIDSSVDQTQDSFALNNGYKLDLRSGVAYKLENLKLISNQIKTDKDVLNYYNQFTLLEKELNEDLLKQYKNIIKDSIKILFADTTRSLAKQLMGCSIELNQKTKTSNFFIDQDSMIFLCKKTKGNEDEIYFQFLKSMIYKDKIKNSQYPIYLNKLSNGSFISKMGDNSLLYLLKTLNYNLEKYPLFNLYYSKFYDKIREDMFISKYVYSKEKVLEEYHKILKEIKNESFEEERIKQRIEEIQTEEKQFQFNIIN